MKVLNISLLCQTPSDDYEYCSCDLCGEKFTNQSDYFKHVSFEHDNSNSGGTPSKSDHVNGDTLDMSCLSCNGSSSACKHSKLGL